MENRTSTRHALSLNALVNPNVERSWRYQIQGFCDTGMLLVEQNGRSRRSLPGINQGEEVDIHLGVPTSVKDKHFRLEGGAVRDMDIGIGINFLKRMDQHVLACLSGGHGLNPSSKVGQIKRQVLRKNMPEKKHA